MATRSKVQFLRQVVRSRFDVKNRCLLPRGRNLKNSLNSLSSHNDVVAIRRVFRYTCYLCNHGPRVTPSSELRITKKYAQRRQSAGRSFPPTVDRSTLATRDRNNNANDPIFNCRTESCDTNVAPPTSIDSGKQFFASSASQNSVTANGTTLLTQTEQLNAFDFTVGTTRRCFHAP